MIDLHYDLLMVCYLKIRENKISDLITFCNEVYKNDNITGGILNLYFMSKEEMLNRLNIKEINVLSMIKTTTSLIRKIMNTDNFVFEVEGCDYLEINDLEELYEVGLRAIAPVWNNKNKYGSGILSDSGLTEEGSILVNKAIDLRIGIDLSHANENTFWDIIKIVKERNKDNPIVYASHSNAISLCNKKRNLTDEQIKAVKSVNGIIGLVTYKEFVKIDNNKYSNKEMEDFFVDHIIYVSNLLGSFDNIAIATDDMNFDPDIDYHNKNIFDMKTISNDLKNALLRHNISLENVNKIMYNNGMRLINRLNRRII